MTRLADILERLLRLLRVPVEDVGARARLDVDQGYLMADDVVQLACDLEPLLRDPAARLLFLRALQLLGIRSSALDRIAEEDSRHRPGGLHRPVRARDRSVGGDDSQPKQCRCPSGDADRLETGQGRVRDRAVESDDYDELDRERRLAPGEERRAEGGDAEQGEQRMLAPQDEGTGAEAEQGIRERVRTYGDRRRRAVRASGESAEVRQALSARPGERMLIADELESAEQPQSEGEPGIEDEGRYGGQAALERFDHPQ